MELSVHGLTGSLSTHAMLFKLVITFFTKSLTTKAIALLALSSTVSHKGVIYQDIYEDIWNIIKKEIVQRLLSNWSK